MIAEIRNKASRESRQSEDVLTGSFFGTLRYLPIEIGLKPILNGVTFEDRVLNQQLKLGDLIQNQEENPKYLFWEKPHGREEIDLILDFDDIIIGIEVKFKSGLSNSFEKEVAGNEKKTANQLANYARLIKKRYTKKKCYLLFLAEQIKDKEIYFNSLEKVNSHNLQGFGYISWQKIYNILNKQHSNSFPSALIIKDLKDYLKSKYLNGFSGFCLIKPKISIQNKTFKFSNRKNNEMIEGEKELVAAYKFIRDFHHELSELIKPLEEKITIQKEEQNYLFSDLKKGKVLILNPNNEWGWLCRSFIKVYKCGDFPSSLFSVEFKVSIGNEMKPELILGRHEYSSMENINDTSQLKNETLSFRSERHIKRGFYLENIKEDVLISKKEPKNRKSEHKYFEKGLFCFYPLLDINSSNIHEKIFDRFVEVNDTFEKYTT